MYKCINIIFSIYMHFIAGFNINEFDSVTFGYDPKSLWQLLNFFQVYSQ